MLQNPTTRLLVVVTLLAGSSLGGIVHGSLRNAHEAEMIFLLTNPDGPAGDIVAWRAKNPGCVGWPSAALASGTCSGKAAAGPRAAPPVAG